MVLLLAFVPRAAHSQTRDSDNVVVLGQRIGPALVGMQPKALLQALGSPDKSMSLEHATVYVYTNFDLTVWVNDRKNRVTEVSTSSARYRTADGIRVGSSELELVATLGRPKWKKDWQDPGPGGKLSDTTYCYTDKATFILGGPGTEDAGRIRMIKVWLDGKC